eukprot:scaffold203493_cov52-Prasinocladus_malaysianus.AAC.1
MRALQAHGTGTALGDPIELGAATSVLKSSAVSGPISFLAAKSSVNHSEAAAGTIGLLYCTALVQKRLQASLIHLRQLNPHLETFLGSTSQANFWLTPRQNLGTTSSVPVAFAVGTSSFAYMGTNAHATVGSLAASTAATTTATILWDRGLMHVAPLPHWIVNKHINHPSDLVVEGAVLASNTAFLLDHQISGLPLFPATGYMEILMGGLMVSSDARRDLCESTLFNATIRRALVLHEGGSNDAVLVRCSVSGSAGVVAITSASGRSSAYTPHFNGRLGGQISLDCLPATCPNPSSDIVFAQLLAPLSLIGSLQRTERTACAFDPAALDACLHLSAAPIRKASAQTDVPVSIDSVHLSKIPPGCSHAIVVPREDNERKTPLAGMRDCKASSHLDVQGMVTKAMQPSHKSGISSAGMYSRLRLSSEWVANAADERTERDTLRMSFSSSTWFTMAATLQLAPNVSAAVNLSAIEGFNSADIKGTSVHALCSVLKTATMENPAFASSLSMTSCLNPSAIPPTASLSLGSQPATGSH